MNVPQFIEDPGGKGVRLFAGARLAPEKAALARCLAVSRLPWVAEPIVALPDLHWKERLETPSSTAVATRDDIVASFSSPSQNCGMTLLTTPLGEEDLSERFIDGLMDELRDSIPRRRKTPAIERELVLDLCRRGAPAAAARYGLDPAQCGKIELGGNALDGEDPGLEELLSTLDEQAIQSGRVSFAFVGGGNHFLELQVVEDILDAGACGRMGLEKGRLVVMFHTGSERLGHDLGRLYSWRRKTDPKRRRNLFWRKIRMHLMRDVHGLDDVRRRWEYHFRRLDHVAVPAESAEGRRLVLTLKVAANYGYANRVAVAGGIQQALRRATGKSEIQVGLVADLSHNTIHRERISGRDLWVHRHNAARIVGPARLPAGHPYAGLGQPLMVPGTNRTSSFVVVGQDGAEATLLSMDHGAGRTVERWTEAGLLRPRPDRVTRKYTYKAPGPEILVHQSDEAVEEVMAIAAAGDVARPVARLRPVAVLKA